MQITSSDFQNLEPLPERFSRDGENINPSLTFSEIPEEAASLTLIVDDPDSPNGVFTHWILYNMTPATLQIVEGSLPMSGLQGFNDFGEDSYGGPQPHSGTHRYVFRLIALDQMLKFDEGTKVTRQVIDDALEEHILEEAQIIGTYSAS